MKDIKLLKDLYYIFNPSGEEDIMIKFVKKTLKTYGIKYRTSGNIIYSLKKDTPLLCAHMDSVSTLPVRKLKISGDIINASGNIGADDKNGIWIILKLLKIHKNNVSFIFSDQEEIGGNLYDFLKKRKNIVNTLLYGLVFDRKGCSDIVCTENGYGVQKFENDLHKIGKKYKYKPNMGTFSDCDAIKEYISCVNLSCGYYYPHTDFEFTHLTALNKAFLFGKDILKKLKTKYETPEGFLWDYDTDYDDDYYSDFNFDFDKQDYDTYEYNSYKEDKTIKFLKRD